MTKVRHSFLQSEDEFGWDDAEEVLRNHDVVVFTPYELHWLTDAMKKKVGTEHGILHFLEETRSMADDQDWHEEQVGNQTMILEGCQVLLAKLLRFSKDGLGDV